MAVNETVSKKRATKVLIAGFIGLWPIFFLLVMWALAQWGVGEGEFSLAPRETTRNVVILVAALGATLIWNVGTIVLGVKTFKRRAAGRGRALTGVVLAAIGTVALALLLIAGIAISFILGRAGEGKLSAQERVKKCRMAQENIANMLGPEMYGFDHPDARPEDLKELDLSPQGDLVEPEDGLAYTTDPTVFDCPADDDPKDLDYAVDIPPEGGVMVRCIDPAGVKEGHNP